MIKIILNQYLILVSILTIIYFIGRITKLFINTNFKNIYEEVFTHIFIGLFISVLAFSIYHTNFKTINILLAIPILFILINERKKICFQNPFIKVKFINVFKSTIILYCVPTIVFIIYCFRNFSLPGYSNGLFTRDSIAYSDISRTIYLTGQENIREGINILFNLTGVEPYHYFDLWTNSMIFSTFGNSSVINLNFVTYPLLISASLIGILSFFKKIDLKAILITITLSLLSGIYFEFFKNNELLKYYEGYFNTSVLFTGKYAIYYMISILSVIFLKKGSVLNSLLILSILPIVSIGTAPAVLFSLFVYLFYLFYKKKHKITILIFEIFILSISIFIFYFNLSINSKNSIILESSIFGYIIENGFNFFLIKYSIFHTLEPLLRLLILYFPYIFLVLFLNYKIKKEKILINENLIHLGRIVLIMIGSGLIFSLVLFNTPDSGQIFYNCLPILNILFIVFFIESLNKIRFEGNFIKSVLIISFVLISLKSFVSNYRISKEYNYIYDYSFEFKKKILKIVENNLGNIAYLQNNDYKSTFHEEIHRRPITFCKEIYDYINITCINDLNFYKKDIFDSYYYDINEYLYHNSISKIKFENSKIVFCKKFNYKYLVTINSLAPSIFKNYYTDSIIDHNTNQIFYKLNFEPN